MPCYLGRTLGAKAAQVAQTAHLPHKVSPFQEALNLGFRCLLSRHMCHPMWCFATMWNKYLSLSAAHCFFPFTGQKHATAVPQVYQVTDRLQARQHVVVYMPPLFKHLSEDC